MTHTLGNVGQISLASRKKTVYLYFWVSCNLIPDITAVAATDLCHYARSVSKRFSRGRTMFVLKGLEVTS
jgi:hypothetical protein